MIHNMIHILITMRISQYFEWNQNFLNFYYFIDFKFQMGIIMIWEYFEATSPPLSHFVFVFVFFFLFLFLFLFVCLFCFVLFFFFFCFLFVFFLFVCFFYFYFFIYGFESFKLLWRFQVYFGHYISLGVFWSF